MRPSLPKLGLGTAGIGNLYAPVSEADARATVQAAVEDGLSYFDTAPHYGFGLAERRLGDALAELDPDGRVLVSTKVGRLLEPTGSRRERHGFVDADPFEPRFDYGEEAVLRSVVESLGRLRRDRIDILLVHDLGALTHGQEHARHLRAFLDGGYPAMCALKTGGAVGAIGIGVNEVEICEYLIERIELDFILIAGRYTLLDRSAGERLLPACRAKGIAVIVGGPYNSGILAQPMRQGLDLRYDYRPPSEEVLARASALERICRGFGIPLAAAALQFPLRHPGVASVIPGAVGPAQVKETIERMEARIPDALWTALAEEKLPA